MTGTEAKEWGLSASGFGVTGFAERMFSGHYYSGAAGAFEIGSIKMADS